MNTLGERIKQIRQKLNLSQIDFALLVGFKTPSSVSKLEKNDLEPNIEAIINIGRAGAVSLHWLLTGKNYTYPSISTTGTQSNSNQYIEDSEIIVSAITTFTNKKEILDNFDFYGLHIGMTKEQVKKSFPVDKMTQAVVKQKGELDAIEAEKSLRFDTVFLTRFYPIFWPKEFQRGNVEFFLLYYDHKDCLYSITVYYPCPIDNIKQAAFKKALLEKLPLNSICKVMYYTIGIKQEFFKIVIEDTQVINEAMQYYKEKFEKEI